MKPLIHILTVAIMAGSALVQALRADLITGEIDFGGSITLDTSSAGNASAVTSWGLTEALNATGTFATPPYDIAAGTVITFAPGNWNFNTSSPVTNFWSVGGYRFELLSSQFSAQGGTPGQNNGFVFVQGMGVVSGNGFTPTACLWSFHTQDPSSSGSPPTWSFATATASQEINGAPVLQIRALTNGTVVSWSDPTFTLQVAPTPTATYSNVPGATNPYTNSFVGPKRFFRLNQ